MAPSSYGFPPGTVLTDRVPSGFRALRRSGVAVRAVDGRDAPAVEEGLHARVVIPLLALGAVRFEVAAPVRVVRVVRSSGAIGLAYGTLPGHPEVGEESFVVRRQAGRPDDVRAARPVAPGVPVLPGRTARPSLPAPVHRPLPPRPPAVVTLLAHASGASAPPTRPAA